MEDFAAMRHRPDDGPLATPVTAWCCLSLPIADTVQVAFDSEEKLPNGSVPQLETCLQRVPADVCNVNCEYAERWRKVIHHSWGPTGLLLHISVCLTNYRVICFTLELACPPCGNIYFTTTSGL